MRPYAKYYVDPSIYSDLRRAVGDFAKQIDAELLTIGDLLGSGAFGNVYQGILKINKVPLKVAVKQLKVNMLFYFMLCFQAKMLKDDKF